MTVALAPPDAFPSTVFSASLAAVPQPTEPSSGAGGSMSSPRAPLLAKLQQKVSSRGLFPAKERTCYESQSASLKLNMPRVHLTFRVRRSASASCGCVSTGQGKKEIPRAGQPAWLSPLAPPAPHAAVTSTPQASRRTARGCVTH